MRVRLSEVLAAAGVSAFFVGMLVPVFAQGKGGHMRSSCLSNLKQLGLSEIQYAADADDRLSPSAAWMDATYPYTKSWGVYRCPSVPEGAYGYAFDRALGGQRLPDEASDLPMVYDSTNLAKNASDWVASLPRPGRHRKDGGNETQDYVVYVDGHARGILQP